MMKVLFGAVIGLLGLVPIPNAFAAPIFVPNNSFESPVAIFSYSINIDSWQKNPPLPNYDTGNYEWSQFTGIFQNQNDSTHIDNCDGAQAVWIFADPEAGIFQDYDSTDWRNLPPTHAFNAVYEVGRTYTLKTGFVGQGGGMWDGATIEMSLYYRDAASNQVPVAISVVTNDPAVFVNHTHLFDFQAVLPMVQATDPCAGQHIGIKFRSTVPLDFQGGYWDLDNVRLSDEYVSPTPMLGQPRFSNGQLSFTVFSQAGSVLEILSAPAVSLPVSNWTSAGFVTNQLDRSVFSVQAGAGQMWYRARKVQ